jgi:hypothetical protein
MLLAISIHEDSTYCIMEENIQLVKGQRHVY